ALRSYLRTSTVLSSLSHVVHRTSLPSTSLFLSLFFFQEYGHHRDLHSFPTRRSSDLQDRHCGPCHGAAARAGVDAESCAGETPLPAQISWSALADAFDEAEHMRCTVHRLKVTHSGAPPQDGEPGIHNPRPPIVDSGSRATARSPE